MALAYNWESFIRIHGGESGARDMFEKAMDELLRAENPDKEVHRVKASQGDGGIDVYVHQKEGIDVFQCKFFMEKLNSSRWSQVKESFQRAVEYMQTEEAKGLKMIGWYLCMPREMQKEDIDKWNDFMRERDFQGIAIKIVDGNEIIQRMQKSDRQGGTDLIHKYFDVPEIVRNDLNGVPQCLTPIPPVNRRVGLVGREDIQRMVVSMLEEQGRMALVSGLGGIGKTAVMQWICNDLKEEGKYVAWIACRDNLKEDFLILGDALGIHEQDSDTAYKMIISSIKNRLNGSLYLFIDNMTENPSREVLSDLYSLNGHIMVTSRRINDAFPVIMLEELKEPAAVTMFFKYYNGDINRSYEETVKDIVTSVNRHTLLIELLAKAAKKTGGTLDDFNRKLESKGVYDVFRREIDTAHDGNITIEECVIRLYEVSHLSEAHKDILKLFSIFSAEQEIYYKVAEWASLDMNALDELVELAWIEQTGLENNYKIHQIIRESIIKQMQRKGENIRIEDYGNLLSALINTDNYIPKEYDFKITKERLVMVEDVSEYINDRIKEIKEKNDYSFDNCQFLIYSAELFQSIAYITRLQGDYDKAMDYYKKAIDIYSRVLGKDHSFMGTVYDNIGILYCHKGCYKEALEMYEKAITIDEKIYEAKHPTMATLYNNIAAAYSGLQEYKKAIDFQKKAFDIDMDKYGPNHPKIGIDYNNMGGLYMKIGEAEKALNCYSEALRIREHEFGPNHIETAKVYNNIAGALIRHGDIEKARDSYNKALNICERVLGPMHPDTAAVYNNMARMFYEQGEDKRALDYFELTLPILKEKLGEKHPQTQSVQNNIDIMRQYMENNDHE